MKQKAFFFVPYLLWIILYVIAPLVLILYQSFFDLNHQLTLSNYAEYLSSGVYLKMTINSVWYAFLITLITLLISYPTAYVINHLPNKQFWLLLVILPTWINLLLKTYAFIGLFSRTGTVNQFLQFVGLGSHQLLFTDASFMFVAAYIEIPFMVLPIFNNLAEINPSLINASYDLGATRWQTFWRIVWPLSLPGVKAGIQAVFIPSLSLFMITRLIGGNRVITLGTAIEEHFLTTQNWGMGSTIGVILIIAMVIIMLVTSDREQKGGHK